MNSQQHKISVIGAGLAGLTMTAALAVRNFRVELIAPGVPDAGALSSGAYGNARSTALLQAGVVFYQRLGVWDRIAQTAAPLLKMRLLDDRQSQTRPFEITFSPTGIKGGRRLDAFGSNVPNAQLEAALLNIVTDRGVKIHDGTLAHLDVGRDKAVARLKDGTKIPSALVIAADGANSLVRRLSKIGVEEHEYDQSALTFVISHALPHDNISSEFQKKEGPLTLVPLCGNRSAIVWVKRKKTAQDLMTLSPDALAVLLEREMNACLGHIGVEAGPGFFPVISRKAKTMIAPRVALIAEAAHAMPPIGAQGLNASVMDVAWLVHALESARQKNADPGGRATLRAYETSRKGDVNARFAAVNALNKMVTGGFAGADFFRQAGLKATKASPVLRDFFMRKGMMREEDLPDAPDIPDIKGIQDTMPGTKNMETT